MQRLPFEVPSKLKQSVVATNAQRMFELKAAWDTSNEICTRFGAPWLVQVSKSASQRISDETNGIGKVLALLGDGAPEVSLPQPVTLEALLDAARAIERAADARLQRLQAQIDEAVYDLYEISEQDQALIERELGDRPPELVWPQMEGKSDQEKRREHVRRLLSYFLLQALKEKRDGVLPLTDGAGRTTALAEIRRRMEETFGEEAAFKMESEIKQVLGHDVADWLDGPFIKWHTQLYKRCPVIWQISSSDHHHTFNCFVYYHKLDADTLRKVQTLYLWPQRRAIESALETARRDQREGVSGASSRVEGAEQDLEVLEAFEEQLLSVIEARVSYEPPEWAEGPFRGGIYDPELDDGVKINLMPLQEAGILRYKRLV